MKSHLDKCSSSVPVIGFVLADRARAETFLSACRLVIEAISFGGVHTAAEIGLDMIRWKSEKHFTSWLNLCPPSRISGGKPLSRQPRKGHNRAADILRLCAQSALKSKSALGAFGRRLKARLDAPKAIKAVAHKLARIVYRMLKYGQQYRDAGERYYEQKYQHHLICRLHKQAAAFGFQLTLQQGSVITVS